MHLAAAHYRIRWEWETLLQSLQPPDNCIRFWAYEIRQRTKPIKERKREMRERGGISSSLFITPT